MTGPQASRPPVEDMKKTATAKKRNAKRTADKAGVIAYRTKDGEETEVLIVSARKFENQWVFPVGTVEKGESLDAAARRECREESGYRVEIGRQLPTFTISSDGAGKRFTFFLARVVGEAGEREPDRQIRWLPASAVADALPAVFQAVARQAVALITA